MDTRRMTTEQAASAAIDAVRHLISELGCPMRLRDVGVHERDFSALAEAVMEEVPTMENPRPITASPTFSNCSSALGKPRWCSLKPWPARHVLDITVYARAVAACHRGDS